MRLIPLAFSALALLLAVVALTVALTRNTTSTQFEPGSYDRGSPYARPSVP